MVSNKIERINKMMKIRISPENYSLRKKERIETKNFNSLDE